MKVEEKKTYVGVVEDNLDPMKLGRVRVRVLDIFDNMKVDDIPWATPYKDLNGNSSNIPDKGKVLMVVFDQGDKYKPEFISSDHFNINLEKKLVSLTGDNYISMKSILFDHKTQIYVNDQEGLKLDHKYNNINITENTVDINLKDNNRHLNLGDATATQQAILGNHWMDWFDEFVDNLMGNNGGPYLGNMGAPVIANPALIQVLQKYKQLRDPVFLSHHVNIVDNDKISTVRAFKREDDSQIGDSWQSTKQDNNLTKNTNDDFKPQDGPKPIYDDKHVEPKSNDIIAATNSSNNKIGEKVNTNPPVEPLSSKKSNPKIDKLISFMKSKGYVVYESINILNMISMQSTRKDNGIVSNKFDDLLSVFYKNKNNNWELLEYQITTTPGFVPKTELLPNKVSILALGQYVDQCSLDIYQSDKNHKCLRFNEVTIIKNDVNDRYNYTSIKETGRFPITIHRSSSKGSAESVFNYSEGAQVFKNITQYNKFILLCEEQIKLKNTFTYTLCRASDFDRFVPNSDIVDNNLRSNLDTNISNWEPGKRIKSNILSEKNVRVEWYIVNGVEIGTYRGTLKSEKDKDIKSEDFINNNLNELEKIITNEADKDFKELLSKNILDKKIKSEIFSKKDIRVEWYIENDEINSIYVGILKSSKGRDIKVEEFRSKDLKSLEDLIRIEAKNDINELSSQ